MKWFRFYGEVLNDPKVQTLDGETFKFWINCLCIASQNNGELPSLKPLAFLLRATPEACAEPLNILIASSLIDEVKNQHGVTHYVHGWEKRQYKSDTSTQRVKRFRNCHETVNETAPEQIQITDTEQNRLRVESAAETAPEKPKPNRGKRLEAYLAEQGTEGVCQEWGKWALSQGMTVPQIDGEMAKFRDWWAASSGQKGVKADWPATWRNWVRRALSEIREREKRDEVFRRKFQK